MKHLSQRWLLPLGFTLTDETFLVVVERYNRPDDSRHKHWYHFGSAALLYTNWQLWTFAGIWAGASIPNPQAWGLDFALPLTFLGMLVPSLRTFNILICVLVAGSAAIWLHGLPHQMGMMAAALLGIAAGIVYNQVAARLQPAEAVVMNPERAE
jgi:predicted branched-subunit amino acid permease